MLDVSLNRNSAGVYALVCGGAMALGWWLRGEFSRGIGAMMPGLLGALAVAAVSLDERKQIRLAALGVAGAAATAVTAGIDFAPVAAFLASPETTPRGLLLGMGKAAVAGAMAGGVFGMALSGIRYRWRDLLWLLPVAALWWAMGVRPGDVLPLTGDMSKTTALSLLGLLAWLHVWKQDRAAVLASLAGSAGLCAGALAGGLVCALAGLRWWSLSQLLWGLGGGIGWGLVAFVLDEDGESPRLVHWGLPAWLGLAAIFWLTPFAAGLDAIDAWALHQPTLGTGLWWAYLAGMTVLLVAVIIDLQLVPQGLSVARVTAWALPWTAWTATLLQFFRMESPKHQGGEHLAEAAALLLCVGLCIYASTRNRRLVRHEVRRDAVFQDL
jgi:hypothetical protein